jgi:hypothetical protein
MSEESSDDVCELCHRGHAVKQRERMRFHQWTDRGYVLCEVTIPVGICGRCGMKSWDEAAEAIIEQAVREARDRLA